MQVLLARGEDHYARRVLDDYIAREVPRKINMSTHVSHAFTVRYANALEAAGFKTLGALKGVSDRDLLEVCDVGEKILKAVRTVLRAVEKGHIVEVEQDEVGDLIDRRLIGSVD
jgi:DNA-directed RNA polymerase alpha subunit